MELTDRQKDSLTELINIGFARAGISLSELTGHRVLLDVPKVSIHTMEKINTALGVFMKGEVASVHQIFSGPVAGDALLLLDYEGAVMLIELLTDEPSIPRRVNPSGREVLTETGNILLSACLGMFRNLLQVQVSFSVPRLQLETLGDVLNSIVIGNEGLRYALVVHTGFRLRDSEVSGYLVIILSVASLDRLIHEVEGWKQRQTQG